METRAPKKALNSRDACRHGAPCPPGQHCRDGICIYGAARTDNDPGRVPFGKIPQ